nr:hybrid signal transduction histidine kinase M [Tanacetum cinerariifolium]
MKISPTLHLKRRVCFRIVVQSVRASPCQGGRFVAAAIKFPKALFGILFFNLMVKQVSLARQAASFIALREATLAEVPGSSSVSDVTAVDASHTVSSVVTFATVENVEAFVTTPGNTKALWDHLKDLFRYNKDARAINLDNELHSIKIGKMTINEYCTKIKSMTHRLNNLGCAVSEKNLVIYAINGLDSCFATLVEIIQHCESLPTFETTRNMLLLKESSFNDEFGVTTMFESSLSSSTVLMASSSSSNKGNTNKPSNIPQICNHFNKELCKFGDRCKYIHDHRNQSGLNPKNHGTVTSGRASGSQFYDRPNSTCPSRLLPHPLGPTPHPGQGVLDLAPAHYASQSTTLPSAFSTMTLQDPTWHMDTAQAISIQLPSCQLFLVLSSRQVLPHDTNTSAIQQRFHADGTLRRYKACLVANGSSQQLGVDFDETFSPVVKPATIRTPFGFVDSQYPHHVCLLQRSLYGLKQAPRAWFQRFASYVTRARFYHSRCDSSLFICRLGSQIIDSLHNEFDMTDPGELNYFLGISDDRTSTCLFLSQRKYALQLLERAQMVYCNPSQTPVDTDSKLGPKGVPVKDPTLSTSGYYVFVGDNLLSWSAKRQHTLSRSTAKAEYHGVANVVVETAWLPNLLRELDSPLSTATLIYCDNVSAVYMFASPVQHQRTKHIEINIHFVRDMVTVGQVRVLHVPS